MRGRLSSIATISIIIILSGCTAPAHTERADELTVAATPTQTPAEPSHDRVHRAAKGPGCASCGKSQAHSLPELSRKEFSKQIAAFASEPLTDGSLALETLLFHNVRSREYLASVGASDLDETHRAFLERELARDHVLVSLRIVDSHGVERLTVKPTRLPLRERMHVRSSSTVNLQGAELSGTVVRVALDRLWVRY